MFDAAFFDAPTERANTGSVKWDMRQELFGNPDVTPLWVADMDFRSPPAIAEALIKRAQHEIFGYTMPQDDFKQAIVDWYATRHHWQIQPEWIVATPGVVFGLYASVRAFTKREDPIAIQTPVYKPFFLCVQENERTLVDIPLTFDGTRYTFDADQLDQALVGVKMLIICNPHNPVGQVWNEQELNAIADSCIKHDVLLLSDDIHSDLVLYNHYTPIGRLRPDLADRLITFGAPSKTFNVPGLGAAFALIPNPALREQLELEKHRSGIYMINAFGIAGLTAAYNHGAAWLDGALEYLRGNYELIVKTFAEHPIIKVMPCEGTYLAWLDVRDLRQDEDTIFKKLCEEAHVGLERGSTFGENGRGFWRLNFATQRDRLRDALQRIGETLS